MADIKIIVDSGDVVTAAKRVDKLGNSVSSTGKQSQVASSKIDSASRGMNQFGAVAKNGGKKLNTFNMQIQQGGYQLQDFVVQLQGGTSVFTAFGQQGSQFAGVFGPQGAVIGAVIAIGSAVGGMAYKMLTAGEEVRDFQEILEDTSDILEKLADANKSATMSNKELEDSFGTASVQIKSTLALLRSIAENEAQGGIDKLAASLTSLYEVRGDGDIRTRVAELFDVGLVYAMTKAQKAARKEARSLTAEFVNAQSALSASEGNIEGQIVATQRLLDVAITLANVSGDVNKEEEALIKKLSESLLKMRETQTVKEEILSTYEDILGTEEALAESTEALNELFEARLGTIDDIANLYEDILGSSKGLFQAETALNNLFEARLGTIDGTANNYVDLLGSSKGLLQAETALNNLYSDRLGTTDDTAEGGSGGGKSPLQTLQEQIALQQTLLGKTEAQQQIINALGVDYQSNYKPSVIDALETQITLTGILSDAETKRKDALEQAAKQQEQLADYIANSMGDALMGIVDGTMTVKDAFKSMARDIIKQLYQVLVVQRLVGSAEKGTGIAGAIAGAFQADGGAWSNGSQIQAYANGGVVGGPTTFPMAGGKTGLMGEAGPEAIMPLKRGANGKLGVQMEGGGGDTIVVNQSFNFQANGDATIKQLIAQAAPKIAQMTKSSLLDDRRRGGSTKAAFG